MSTSATQRRKIALIVGVNEAPHAEKAALRFAEASAQRLAAVLATPACGFTICGDGPLLGPQATAAAVRRTILRQLRELEQPDDLLLIAFVGHGIPLAGDNRDDVLLATADLDLAVAEIDASDCLSTSWLLQRALQHDKPGSVLLLLGCCHAGAVGEEQLRPELRQLRERLHALGISLSQPVPGSALLRRAIAAVGSQEQAREADGLTDFVRLLVAGLQGAAADPHDGRVSAESLGSYLATHASEQVMRFGPESGSLALAFDPSWRGRAAAPHQPWVNVPPVNEQFQGRVEELAQLGAWLADDGVTAAALMPAISGIGGIGKSQLAIKFAHQYRARFPGGVFWISAEQADTIELQIAACGGHAGLRLFDDDPQLGDRLRLGSSKTRGVSSRGSFEGELELDEPEPRPRLTMQQRAQRVLEALAQPEPRLLIFDNVEDASVLDSWRPSGNGCRVLVTTRNQDVALFGARPLKLEPLDIESGLRLLAEPRAASRGEAVEALLADAGNRTALTAIGDELGWLPLALGLAGAHLGGRVVDFGVYLKQLRTEALRHRSLGGALAEGLPGERSASIVASFALSAQQLQLHDRDGRARAIWQAAACLAPEPIHDDLLLRLAGDAPSDTAGWEAADEAVALLRRIGLIERGRDTHKLHRLLRAYATQITTDADADLARAENAIVAEMEWIEEQDQLNERSPRYREHLEYLTTNLGDRDDLRAAGVCQEYAEALYAAGNVQQALPLFQRAVAMCKALLGDHELTAESMRDLGNALSATQAYTAAQQIYLDASIRSGGEKTAQLGVVLDRGARETLGYGRATAPSRTK